MQEWKPVSSNFHAPNNNIMLTFGIVSSGINEVAKFTLVLGNWQQELPVRGNYDFCLLYSMISILYVAIQM